jgi:hypothetical protein
VVHLAAKVIARSDRAKTMTHEARFVTTREGSQRWFDVFFVSVRTKVANYAGDVAATEDIALIEHYQRNGKSQTQMDVDKVYLR